MPSARAGITKASRDHPPPIRFIFNYSNHHGSKRGPPSSSSDTIASKNRIGRIHPVKIGQCEPFSPRGARFRLRFGDMRNAKVLRGGFPSRTAHSAPAEATAGLISRHLDQAGERQPGFAPASQPRSRGPSPKGPKPRLRAACGQRRSHHRRRGVTRIAGATGSATRREPRHDSAPAGSISPCRGLLIRKAPPHLATPRARHRPMRGRRPAISHRFSTASSATPSATSPAYPTSEVIATMNTTVTSANPTANAHAAGRAKFIVQPTPKRSHTHKLESSGLK